MYLVKVETNTTAFVVKCEDKYQVSATLEAIHDGNLYATDWRGNTEKVKVTVEFGTNEQD